MSRIAIALLAGIWVMLAFVLHHVKAIHREVEQIRIEEIK